jgi:DNA-binding NtrC family response regulator
MKELSCKKSVRILCLEDDDNDRELLEVALVNGGLVFELIHARNRQEFEAALAQGTFDLIISDFNIPAYDGMAALAIVRKVQEQTPFIFVSGTIGEQRAIESLKKGANDFVLKDKRDRLIQVVTSVLRESEEGLKHKGAANP